MDEDVFSFRLLNLLYIITLSHLFIVYVGVAHCTHEPNELTEVLHLAPRDSCHLSTLACVTDAWPQFFSKHDNNIVRPIKVRSNSASISRELGRTIGILRLKRPTLHIRSMVCKLGNTSQY